MEKENKEWLRYSINSVSDHDQITEMWIGTKFYHWEKNMEHD